MRDAEKEDAEMANSAAEDDGRRKQQDAGAEDAGLCGSLMEALNGMFYSILQVDPAEDTVLILQSIDRPAGSQIRMSWSEIMNIYSVLLTEEGQKKFRERLSCEALLAEWRSGERSFSQDIPYIKEEKTNWLNIMVQIRETSGDSCRAYIFVRRNDEEHLLKSIIDLYVYNSCDYFIYLDAKNNSYVMFSGSSSGTPLPPETCDDYASALVDYARDFVVPEDQEMVIREMQIDRVLQQIEMHGSHSFFCGVSDPVRGYTRKQLTYRYYDRSAQMILLSRTDVTGVYLEERARQEELRDMQLQAQTDTLTGLFNYRGIFERVEEALSLRSGKSALLFLDLDNFKQVNDTLGHPEGDRLLKKVARVLRTQSGKRGIQGRVGGDEFIVFLPEISDAGQAKDCAQRICESVSKLSLPMNGAPTISCSVGIAVAPEDGQNYNSLVRCADRHAYRAKALGKNRFFLGKREE